jgi:hypothetical protein
MRTDLIFIPVWIIDKGRKSENEMRDASLFQNMYVNTYRK